MTATIPDTVEGFEETLANPTHLGDYFREGRPTAEFGEFVKGYAKSLTTKNRDLQDDAIRAQVEEVFADLLARHNPEDTRRLNFDPSVPAPRMPAATADRYRQVYNAAAPGAAADRVANVDLGRLVQATYHTPGAIRGDRQGLSTMENELRQVMNSFSSGVPADGGLLIPERLRAELLAVALQSAVVRPRARVIPMDSLRVPFPILDITDNSASVFGGVVAYWTEEAAELTASSPKFGRVVLDAKKLTARADVPDELVQDSIIALNAWISEAYPQACAWYEDVAYHSGTGVGEPLGWNVAGNTALVTITKESGQAADTVVWENIVKMYARMFPSSHSRAVWVAHPNTFPELATMALSVGTGGSAIWLNNGSEGPPMTILGRPLILDEKMETLGDAGDIAYVDFGYYLIGDRQTMTMAASEHAKFISGQTVIKTTMRVDGAPAVKSSVIPQKGGSSSALSPFVRLGARA